MSDIDKDGMLDRDEFAVVSFLFYVFVQQFEYFLQLRLVTLTSYRYSYS